MRVSSVTRGVDPLIGRTLPTMTKRFPTAARSLPVQHGVESTKGGERHMLTVELLDQPTMPVLAIMKIG
jgi:hypothetical protein